MGPEQRVAGTPPSGQPIDPLSNPVYIDTLRRGGELHIEYTAESAGGGSAPSGTKPVIRVVHLKGPDKSEVRSVLALWAFALFSVLLVIPLIALAAGKISATDLTTVLQAVFAGSSGILGAVVGFYFSGQQAKTSSSTNSGSQSK